jgi:hypothetical protein
MKSERKVSVLDPRNRHKKYWNNEGEARKACFVGGLQQHVLVKSLLSSILPGERHRDCARDLGRNKSGSKPRF